MEQIKLAKEDLTELGIETYQDLKTYERAVNLMRGLKGKTRVSLTTEQRLKASGTVQYMIDQQNKRNK